MNNAKLLNEAKAAEYLTLKPKTLAFWRWAGKGPVHRKIGGAVRYSVSDLDAFLEASVRPPSHDGGGVLRKLSASPDG